MCLPLSLFLARFRLGHYNQTGGHMGASKTYNNAKRFDYLPGMFDWICALTAECLTCQNNKQKPKHRNEVPLEEGQNETTPFRTIHINHKGDLFIHQVIEIFTAYWLLMHLLTQPSRNGYIPLQFLNLLYTVEVLPSLIQIS